MTKFLFFLIFVFYQNAAFAETEKKYINFSSDHSLWQDKFKEPKKGQILRADIMQPSRKIKKDKNENSSKR